MQGATASRAGAANRRPGYTGRPTSRLERSFRAQGLQRVAGVDEVGRGSLFGPVVAAAVILDPANPVRGLNDSKVLDPAARTKLHRRILERALAVSVGASDSGHIDRLNIYQATRRAMREAVLGLRPEPAALLVDAVTLDIGLPQKSVIQGDRRSVSVAAASIVAKVERDRWMEQWDKIFPEYGLAGNKGYATPGHLRALERFGPTPLHRQSFHPVAVCAKFGCEWPPLNEMDFLPLFAPIEAAERSAG